MEEIALITGIVLIFTGFLYGWLIGLFTYGWYRGKSVFDNSSENPATKVSVIIATRNEKRGIGNLLSDLTAQHYTGSLFEVLVVDDHSEDNTIEIVRNIIEGKKYEGFKLINLATIGATDGLTRQINVQHIDYGGKKAAIACGISQSTGDVILLTDADCRIGPDWVSSMVSCFNDKTKMMVFGPVAYFPEGGLLNRFQSLEFSGLIASGAGAAMAQLPFICNGANLAYRKEAFLKVSGYEGNEKFISGDDVFLMHKMKKEFGAQAIGFAKDLRTLVRTYPAPGLKAFINQRIRWASKTKGYRDPLSMFTATTVFFFNLFIIAAFFGGFCHPVYFLFSAGGILWKSLIDFPLMWGITGFNKEKRLMWCYLPFQVAYPFYVVIAGVWSLFGRKKW